MLSAHLPGWLSVISSRCLHTTLSTKTRSQRRYSIFEASIPELPSSPRPSTHRELTPNWGTSLLTGMHYDKSATKTAFIFFFRTLQTLNKKRVRDSSHHPYVIFTHTQEGKSESKVPPRTHFWTTAFTVLSDGNRRPWRCSLFHFAKHMKGQGGRVGSVC
jgi:hypothetical protein